MGSIARTGVLVMGIFTNLPSDLMHYLINKVDQDLIDLADKVRIRAVCSSWDSLLPIIPKLQSKHLPWMLQLDKEKGASIYSIHQPQNYPLDLPQIRNKVFKGSSHGWIVTLDDTNGGGSFDDICLFNPLTRAQIQLPPRSTFPDVIEYHPERATQEYTLKEETHGPVYYSKEEAILYKIHKIVLSSSPTCTDCNALVIYGNYGFLAWCRPQHKEWTLVEPSKAAYPDGYFDVIFHDGKVYAVHFSGKLVVYDSIHPEGFFREVVTEVPPNVVATTPTYLVHCRNVGIVMAARFVDCQRDGAKSPILETYWFNLYKLVDSTTDDGSKTWVEIEDIGDNMLFLGLNSSLSITVTEEFNLLGYKRNCVYFTDDECNVFYGKSKCQENSDTGICDLEDESTDALPGFECEPGFFWPPPIWVTPSAY